MWVMRHRDAGPDTGQVLDQPDGPGYGHPNGLARRRAATLPEVLTTAPPRRL